MEKSMTIDSGSTTNAHPAPPVAFTRNDFLRAGLLFAAALAVYFPALHGGFLWDDDAHVTKPALQSLRGLGRIWFELGATQQYYPVLHSAFWLEHRLWGDAVLGYHLLNVALHATSAVLVVCAMRRLGLPGAWFAAFIFALHPIAVESVAWISEQKNTLSAALVLGALLIYLRFDATRRRRAYVVATGLFVLAVLTKTVTATLPAALWVIAWWRRGELRARRDVWPLAPWFAFAAVAGGFTAWVERKLIGAEGAEFALSFWSRAQLAGRVVWFYLGKIIWPSNLMFVYPHWTIAASALGPWLPTATGVVGFAFFAALARRHRGPLAAALLFVGLLFPVLGFLNVYPFLFSYVADHFQYLASLAVIVPAAATLTRWTARWPRGFQITAAAALIAILGGLSHREAAVYRDAETLYRTTLARNPDAWLAHFNLGVLLAEQNPNDLNPAIAEYRATLRLKPDHWAAHSNLGSALLRSPGHDDEAIAEFEAALRYKPDYAEGHNNLGVALTRRPDRLDEAIEELRTALRLRTDYAEAHSNLAHALAKQPGGAEAAVTEYREALRLKPDAVAHYHLAGALARLPGHLPEAIAEYRAALQLNPRYLEAYNNLGSALARTPDGFSAAIESYRAALALDPHNADLHNNLGNVLVKMPERRADAVAEYRAALAIDPDNAETHNNLGVALSDDPARLAEALAEFETAVRLKLDFAAAHYCLAVVFLRMPNRRAEAEAELETVLRLQPDFAPASRLLARLRAAPRR